MNKVISALKNYFLQSFKLRNKEDYSALFKRTEYRGKIYKTYPWFYLRVFAVLFALFTVYAVTVSAFYNSGMDRIAFYLLGGAFLDFAVLVLIYELYPYNDFSFLKLICVCLIAGSAGSVLSSLIYGLCSNSGLTLLGWDLAVTAGVGEELSKAIPAIVCIALFKKKECPLTGFLIGAAVGTWFSVTENASYIWSNWLGDRVFTAIVRALGCVFSHAVWTALICWAYCKFRKPFLNFRFYAVVVFCMATHFCIDMPLSGIILYSEAAVCGLATLIFGFTVFYKERKKALSGEETAVQNEAPSEVCGFPPAHKANLTAVGFGAALCALLLVFAYVYSPYRYPTTVFNTEDEFLSYVQNGYQINPDEEREYDEDYFNNVETFTYDEQTEEKVLTYCEQHVSDGDITYVYVYSLRPVSDEVTDDGESGGVTDGTTEDAGGEEGSGEETPVEMALQLSYVAVQITVDGENIKYYEHAYFFPDYELRFYLINDEADFSYLEVADGKILMKQRVNGLGWQSITMISVCSAVAVAGICTYIIMRKKAKKDN